MGKKGNNVKQKKKMTKKEKKKANHLKLMQGKKNDGPISSGNNNFNQDSNKKAA